MCRRYAQLGMVLITSVKFHWNPNSSLACNKISLFIALVAILCSQADHASYIYAQLGMVLITPVKFHWNPASSLTCESRTSWMRTYWQTAKAITMSPKNIGRHNYWMFMFVWLFFINNIQCIPYTFNILCFKFSLIFFVYVSPLQSSNDI
jgi:hypothetical protein